MWHIIRISLPVSQSVHRINNKSCKWWSFLQPQQFNLLCIDLHGGR